MTPYEEGVRAQQSNNPEPECQYYPGTDEYSEFADGFCHDIERKKEEVNQRYYGN